MNNTHHSHYEVEIDKVIDALQPAGQSREQLDTIQDNLDHLAAQYQTDESLGSTRYKLYQAQAMLWYRLGDHVKAYQFIQQSIKVRGSSYTAAEQLLQHLQTHKQQKSIKLWVSLIAGPVVALLVVVLLQAIVHFVITKNGLYATSTPVTVTLNVLSILVGIAAAIGLFLWPLWIVMLVKTINYNNSPSGMERSKVAAILFAVFFAYWTWLYTYERDKTKFWVNTALFVVTLSYWGIVAWIWAIIDTANKPDEYYQQYPNFIR